MTFPIFKSRNNEQGVTLLLAILVLSAITAIAFSLATIIFIEIRASGDVTRTEPALYAVQALTEESFFQYKRYISSDIMDVTTCLPKELNPCAIPAIPVIMTQPTPTARTFDKAPRVDTVNPGATNIYPFIDPTLPGSFAQAFTEIAVSHLDNGFYGDMHVTINKYDRYGNKVLPAPVDDAVLAVNGSVSYTIPIGDEGQYELIITNPYTESSMLARIDATRIGGEKEIPLVGRQVLDIVANYLGLSRKYTVNIPLP